MPIKHSFVSARDNSGDAGAVQPDHWNDPHELDPMLAALDLLSPLPDTIIGIDGSGNAYLKPIAEFSVLDSPAFTGTPTAPTPSLGDNTTRIATMAAIQAAIAALVNSSPGTLDTLNELATALGNDANFAATTAATLALKAPLASPTFTGTPAAPTPTAADNTTKIATTAYVQGELTAKAPLASPTFTGTPTAPTPTAGDNTTTLATTAFVQSALLAASLRGVRGVNGSRNSGTATRLDLAADAVIFQASGGSIAIETAVASIACDIATAGPAAGGRDQAGAFSSGATVHFHFIRKNDGTKSLLASLSATAPTLPTGYTSWAYATTLVMSGSNLPLVYVAGSRVMFQSGVSIVATSTATPTSNTSASVAAAVPANALSFDIQSYLDNATATSNIYYVWIGAASGASLFRNVIYVLSSGGSATHTMTGSLPNVGRLVWYIGTSALNRFGFEVLGYRVPNGDS